MRRVVLVAFALAALVGATPALGDDPPTIADGVTIQGVAVGGMTGAEAKAAVYEFVRTPFTLSFRTRNVHATPWQVGAKSHVAEAVSTALTAAAGTAIPLTVSVESTRLWNYVRNLDAALSRPPRNTWVRLLHGRPHLVKARLGFNIIQRPTRTLLWRAIKANRRGPIAVQFHAIRPTLTRSNFPPAVVIHRGKHLLYMYSGRRMSFRARFGIAVGQPIYPTPLGKFRIVTKQRNPWWYPPNSSWAAGAKPIPPGPGNPLGTRWMGLSAPGVGIHGTPDAASIGYSASHGCIRMRIPDAEWLFERVEVGSTVFIVRS